MLSIDRERKLLARVAELERELARREREALTDELTGCLNRRGWEHALDAEQGRCERHGLDAAVAAIDLDDFKELNDTGGHHAGDAMLRRCADVLRATVRGHDCVARPGGDEFAVLAAQIAPTAAEAVGSHLDDALAAAGIRASVGAAALAEAGSLHEAWRVADERMLARKPRFRRDTA